MSDATDRLGAALAGRYRIERELGQGGMATVFLAEDLRHHRKVAIKVLRPELAEALGADRFVREIETTASLRHPHILPLFDSGEAGGLLFYVMPLVEGESLRDRLARERQLPVDDALQIVREVADALSYAHSRGVVQRDIKPENILLEGGHAVIADFGIATAIAAAGGARLTGTGLVLGTPAYLSPEQAAGAERLDGRSDLYALGCTLYEALAGQPPFTGPTVESVVHQHLTARAPSVTQLRPSVPADVAAALERALAKTPADRFATAQEFSGALGTRRPAAAAPGSWAARSGAPGRRRAAIVLGALGLVALVLVGVRVVARGAPQTVALGRRSQVTLEPGLQLDPAISPDGKLLAYADARGALTVQQADGGEPVRVVRDGDGRGRWPAWLPDGQRLIFVAAAGIELVPALGGTARLLVAGSGLARGVTVAPDGRRFAFVSRDTLYAEPVDGGEPRVVTAGWEMHSPAWSPDGRWIAFVSGNLQYVSLTDLGNIGPSSVWVVRAGGGRALRVSDDRSLNMSPAWASPEGLLYVSDREGGRDVYQVSVSRSGKPTGAPRRVTTGLNALGISVSANGRRLAYAAFTETSNVWSLPVPVSGAVSISQARPVTVGNQTIENIGVSPDGQWLAFNSDRSGVTQLYRMRLNTPATEPQQLTSDTAASFWSSWSPDGKEIAFHRFRGERRQVFVVSAEGGRPVAVTDGTEDERTPEWAPDGRRLLLLANYGTQPALHIVSRDSLGRWSAPRTLPVAIGSETVTPNLGNWSPDGQLLACACGPGGLVIIPVDGGSARRLPSPFSTAGWDFPQWSADGRTVYHLSEDSAGHVMAVVAVPLSGAPPRVVVRFDDPTRPWHRFGFRVRAGRMYFTLGDRQSDIWVAEMTAR